MKLSKICIAELQKLRRSSIVVLSFVFYGFFALMAFFVLWMLKNPDSAKSLGLLGAKANFLSIGLTADWNGLYTFFSQMNIAGGMIILSLVFIYLFGREYVEGTAKNMLALPIPRSYFVIAKLIVAVLWMFLLTVSLYIESFLVGYFLGMGSVSPEVYIHEGITLLMSSLVVFTLLPLVAWITVASGGYLAPFGYTIGTLIIGNLMIHTGWARWCPWSIVALLSGLSGPPEKEILLGSTIVLLSTFALGVGLTIHQEAKADNCQ